MHASFETLAPASRIWVYQASAALDDSAKSRIQASLTAFCSTWAAHGVPLKCSFLIDHSQFVIIAVDEEWTGASGCSIDGSVRNLKELGEELMIDFFDRRRAAFLIDGAVKTIPLTGLREALASGILSPETPTFNTLAVTKGDFSERWLIPLKQSWLSRYISNAALA